MEAGDRARCPGGSAKDQRKKEKGGKEVEKGGGARGQANVSLGSGPDEVKEEKKGGGEGKMEDKEAVRAWDRAAAGPAWEAQEEDYMKPRGRGRSSGSNARPGSWVRSPAAQAQTQRSCARSSAAPVSTARAQPREAEAGGVLKGAGAATELTERPDRRQQGKKEAEVVQEPYSENMEDSDLEGPLETVPQRFLNLPVPEGYRLTGEKEETERGPRYLVRTITQTFRRL